MNAARYRRFCEWQDQLIEWIIGRMGPLEALEVPPGKLAVQIIRRGMLDFAADPWLMVADHATDAWVVGIEYADNRSFVLWVLESNRKLPDASMPLPGQCPGPAKRFVVRRGAGLHEPFIPVACLHALVQMLAQYSGDE